MEPLFRIENLTKRRGNGFILEIPYLEFHAGRIYALVGPNGAGKTTLLELLNLLAEPDRGKIVFAGYEITGSSSAQLLRRRQMTMVAQDPFLFHTTVFRNLAYGLRVRSVDRKIIPKEISAALGMVGLSGFENREAYRLSGGETQRVAIARALVLNPGVLSLDEPTVNVDRINTEIIEEIIKKISRENHTTVIFTTHDFSQAGRLADEIISLHQGRIVSTRPENFFFGEIEEANGLKWVTVSESVRIAVATEKSGKAHIAVDPENIILSRRPLESSARNSFLGRINKITAEDPLVRISVNSGVEFVVLITRRSFEEMGLNLGSPVHLTFKTSAVHVF